MFSPSTDHSGLLNAGDNYYTRCHRRPFRLKRAATILSRLLHSIQACTRSSSLDCIDHTRLRLQTLVQCRAVFAFHLADGFSSAKPARLGDAGRRPAARVCCLRAALFARRWSFQRSRLANIVCACAACFAVTTPTALPSRSMRCAAPAGSAVATANR
jgi:hypothetical protein